MTKYQIWIWTASPFIVTIEIFGFIIMVGLLSQGWFMTFLGLVCFSGFIFGNIKLTQFIKTYYNKEQQQ